MASDIPAILSHTRDVVFLGDEEMAIITPSGVRFTDLRRRRGFEEEHPCVVGSRHGRKGGIQALHAQGDLRTADRDQTVLGRASLEGGKVFLQEIEIPDDVLSRSSASGRSGVRDVWHAALVGKF